MKKNKKLGIRKVTLQKLDEPTGGPSFALFAKDGTFPIANRLGF